MATPAEIDMRPFAILTMIIDLHTQKSKEILGVIIVGLVILSIVVYLVGALKQRTVRAIFRKYERVYYSRDEDPFSYWATLFLYGIITIALLFCWVILLSQLFPGL